MCYKNWIKKVEKTVADGEENFCVIQRVYQRKMKEKSGWKMPDFLAKNEGELPWENSLKKAAKMSPSLRSGITQNGFVLFQNSGNLEGKLV